MVPAGAAEYGYWRTVLRVAALCHDIGHLPFSHAAEKELLPDGWDHERVTYELVSSDAMAEVWKSVRPSPEPEDVVKLALGPGKVESHIGRGLAVSCPTVARTQSKARAATGRNSDRWGASESRVCGNPGNVLADLIV